MARQRRADGAPLLPADLDASISGHGGQGPTRPDDMALWDPATSHQQRLPAPPGYPKPAPAPSWASTELPELTGNGKLLSFHRQADTPVAALPVAARAHTESTDLGGLQHRRP
jgi:hypothetical protein